MIKPLKNKIKVSMLKIQPISLNADGHDLYCVRSQIKKEAEKIIDILDKYPDRHRVRSQSDKDSSEVEHMFTVRDVEIASGQSSRLLNQEDAFFFVTSDDPARDVLIRSVLCFDAARQKGVQISANSGIKIQPLSLVVAGQDSEGRYRYNVLCESDGNKIEHIFTVTDSSDVRAVSWQYGSCKAELVQGYMKTNLQCGDSLLTSILWLHEALHYKYADKQQTSSVLVNQLSPKEQEELRETFLEDQEDIRIADERMKHPSKKRWSQEELEQELDTQKNAIDNFSHTNCPPA